MRKPGSMALDKWAISAFLLTSMQGASADDLKNVNLKGSIGAPKSGSPASTVNKSSSSDSSSTNPNDATMTSDMLFVEPKKSTIKKDVPLQEFDQHSVSLTIERSDIVFDKLHGVMISVTNNSDKALVIDGDTAKIRVGDKPLDAVPVFAIQRLIIPPHKYSQDMIDLITKVAPAAVTVSAIPTVQDIRRSQKPILERYGRDEVRRKIEFSRFGRRIVWSHQKASGILYFETNDQLAGAKLDLPVNLLFQPSDKLIVSSIAPTVEPPSTVRAQAPETSATPNSVIAPQTPQTPQ